MRTARSESEPGGASQAGRGCASRPAKPGGAGREGREGLLGQIEIKGIRRGACLVASWFKSAPVMAAAWYLFALCVHEVPSSRLCMRWAGAQAGCWSCPRCRVSTPLGPQRIRMPSPARARRCSPGLRR